MNRKYKAIDCFKFFFKWVGFTAVTTLIVIFCAAGSSTWEAIGEEQTKFVLKWTFGSIPFLTLGVLLFDEYKNWSNHDKNN